MLLKSVFITGGTSGIGLELAKKYYSLGFKVGVCGRSIETLIKEGADFKDKFTFYEADVLNFKDLELAMVDFSSKFGLDIVYANAGIATGSKTKLPDWQRGRTVINVNVIGLLNTFEIATKIMLSKGGGHLVGISSVAGFMGLPGVSSYSASKAAVRVLCETLALDLKQYAIDVTCICPGYIKTPLTQKNNHPMPFLIDAQSCADLIVNAVSKKKLIYIFPWPMKIIALILEMIPRFLYLKIMNIKNFNYSKKEE